MTQKNHQDNQDFDESASISRCPHDAQNPYTMILNELIRDPKISPNCRWLLIYLLSNKDGWSINFNQVLLHVESHIKRDKLRDVFVEAIDAGYMKMIQTKNGNRFGKVIYYVSESPKFKKCLPQPDSPEPEKPVHKKEHSSFSSKPISSERKTTTAKPQNEMPAGGSSSFFYPCLKKCTDLSDNQKHKLMKLKEKDLELILKIAYHPTTEIHGGSTGRIKFIFWLSKDMDDVRERLKTIDNPPEKKSKKDLILGRFIKGQSYNGYEFFNDAIGFGFSKSTHEGNRDWFVRWDSIQKEQEFLDLLKKLGIEK